MISAANAFLLLDAVRRQAGIIADAWGLGPREARWRRASVGRGSGPTSPRTATASALLIVPAPFKRAYIWDLVPVVSVVRTVLARRLAVYLLEWLPPTPSQNDLGLAEYALHRVQRSIAVIQAETGVARAHLAGH